MKRISILLAVCLLRGDCIYNELITANNYTLD